MERRLGEEVGRNRRGGEAPWGRERVGVGVDSGSVCVLVLDRARMRLPYCTRQYTGSPNENQAKPRPCEALPRRSCSRHRSIVAAAGRPFTNTAPSRGLGEDCRSLFILCGVLQYELNSVHTIELNSVHTIERRLCASRTPLRRGPWGRSHRSDLGRDTVRGQRGQQRGPRAGASQLWRWPISPTTVTCCGAPGRLRETALGEMLKKSAPYHVHYIKPL